MNIVAYSPVAAYYTEKFYLITKSKMLCEGILPNNSYAAQVITWNILKKASVGQLQT